MSQPATVQHLNPPELPQNPAFTNVVAVTGPARTVYVGGQNAVSATGEIVGKDDVGAQSAQVFQNIEIALASAGARLEHVIKWNLYVVEGQPLEPGFEAFQQAWGRRPNPPVITMAFVSALARPDFLVELDAVAVIPESRPAAP
jgi:enamine deaminase RidA (YjgF/YER057c/UK114 family)